MLPAAIFSQLSWRLRLPALTVVPVDMLHDPPAFLTYGWDRVPQNPVSHRGGRAAAVSMPSTRAQGFL